MEEERIENQHKERRKKRVKIIKKMILITCFVFIITPIICCIFLLQQLRITQEEVYKIYELVQNLEHTINNQELEVESMATHVEAEEILAAMNLEQDTSANTEEVSQVKKVYLTFDDGPSSKTLEILEILDKYNVKATFFVNGKEGEEAEYIYQKIVEEGHTLGLHSYSHDYDVVYESVDAYAEDLMRLQDYLYEVTGVRSMYVRFPGGSSNTQSEISMIEFIEYVESQGMEYYDWNISSGDSSTLSLTADEIVANCTGNIGVFKTPIILLHDASNKPNTVNALPQIIETINLMDDVELAPITNDTIAVQHIIKE